MRLQPKSVRARLTLWYTLVLSLPLAAFAVGSFALFSRTLYDRTDAFIGDGLAVFTREVAAERRVIPTTIDAIRRTLLEVRFQDFDLLVLDESGALLARSAPRHDDGRDAMAAKLADVLAALPARDSAGVGIRTLAHSTGPQRLHVRPLAVDNRRLTVVGVYPLREVEQALQRIRALFLIAIPLLIASAAIGGWFLAKRSFEPVSAMAARAAEIGATTLHERLPVITDDELGALARVLNQLLDRLEQSFAQQRRFMADASHELRTPAAVVRAEADVTLSREHRTEAEYRESMHVVQDAARRLTRIVDDIFLLARADAGHLVMQPTALHLEDVAHDAVRAVQHIANERHVRVDLAKVTAAPVTGDADLLGRVLLNVLDNAIKHAPDGGRVEVTLTRNGGSHALSVVDDGPGIPAEHQARVFERFYRVDSARSRTERSATSGAGLGLAISRRIAEMHGGRLELVSSRPGRTEFRVDLPAAARMSS
jgi:two-component system OmpR family sensor kinase